MRHPPLTAAGPAPAWPPLVAVAHGSSDPRSAASVSGLIALVRERAPHAGLPGLPAHAAYLSHALPSVPDVLEAVCLTSFGDEPERYARPAVVLPLLLTAAYHSDADLPAVLSAASARLPGLRVSYGRPLGPHQGLLRAAERRLAEAGAPVRGPGSARDRARTVVVLAAAGSSRPAASAAVARAAAAWQRAAGWRAVVPAYASAAGPRPGQAVAALLRAGAPRVLVASYLLAPGVFADQVREQSLAAGASVVSAPLGAAPEVADVLIERYVQAVSDARASAGNEFCLLKARLNPL